MTVSSHVAHGAVGNRIIVPALESLGTSVTALSTVQLSWHPGMNSAFGKAARIAPDDLDFEAMIHSLCEAPWLGQIDGLMTGYLGTAGQASVLAKLVNALKRSNPKALYLCDPVIGDTGGLYVPEAVAAAIREHLWPLADIVTPNLFEFGWLTGKIETDPPHLHQAAKALHKRHVVVTSVLSAPNQIGNLLVSNNNSNCVSHEIFSQTPNGTGDLLAAILLGQLVLGNTASDGLQYAAQTVFSAISHANLHNRPNLSPEHLRALITGQEAAIRKL